MEQFVVKIGTVKNTLVAQLVNILIALNDLAHIDVQDEQLVTIPLYAITITSRTTRTARTAQTTSNIHSTRIILVDRTFRGRTIQLD
jgi:pyrimidine operon attenuation protein/uracil phosphoribosyltransferase